MITMCSRHDERDEKTGIGFERFEQLKMAKIKMKLLVEKPMRLCGVRGNMKDFFSPSIF